jgi:hypothetical protein
MKTSAFTLLILSSTLSLSSVTHAAQPTPEAIEQVISKAFCVDPARQTFAEVKEEDGLMRLYIDRNRFIAETGIQFLVKYLPEKISLKLHRANGGTTLSPLNYDGYQVATAPSDTEPGTVSARNYSVSGRMNDGLMGSAQLQMEISDLNYETKDATRQVTAEDALFTFHKNQRFFSPTTIQLGWKGSRLADTRFRNGKQISRLYASSYHYNLLIGATEINQIVTDLWNGKSIGEAVFRGDGAPVKAAVDKARSVELNYSTGHLTQMGEPFSYRIDGFSLKYQSKVCGGCEGRFDIGIDGPQIYDNAFFDAYHDLLPTHSYASGKISGLEFDKLIASKDALINPFSGTLFSYPNLSGLKSINIPNFKIAAFNDAIDISGLGSLHVRLAEKYVVNGRLILTLKKGADKLQLTLLKTVENKQAAALRQLLLDAVAAGKRNADGTIELVVVIRDNAIIVNDKPL